MTKAERIRPQVRALLAGGTMSIKEIATALEAPCWVVQRALCHSWFEPLPDERRYRLAKAGRNG